MTILTCNQYETTLLNYFYILCFFSFSVFETGVFTRIAHPSCNQPHFMGSKHKWQVATALDRVGLEYVGRE